MSRFRGVLVGCIIVLTLGMGGCRSARLPSRQVLQSGCHVWYDFDGPGRSSAGTYVSVQPDNSSKIYHNSVRDGAVLLPSQQIEWDGDIIGTFDGRRVVISRGDPPEPYYYTDIKPSSLQLSVRWVVDDSEHIDLERSRGCTAEQTALAVAPLTLVVSNALIRPPAKPWKGTDWDRPEVDPNF